MNFTAWIVLFFWGKRWCRRAAPALKSHPARCRFSNEMLKFKTESLGIRESDEKAIC
jgi:hypothetical protein